MTTTDIKQLLAALQPGFPMGSIVQGSAATDATCRGIAINGDTLRINAEGWVLDRIVAHAMSTLTAAGYTVTKVSCAELMVGNQTTSKEGHNGNTTLETTEHDRGKSRSSRRNRRKSDGD